MNLQISKDSAGICRGFTLIELLVTLAIVAIIAVIAAPSLQSFVLNNRIRTQASALTTSLMLARTEAINRRTRVVTCPGNAGGCSGTQWEFGWLVFVDTPPYDAVHKEEEIKLEVHGPLDGNNTLRSTADVGDYVSFDYNGRAAQSGTFILCDKRGFGADSRIIELLATGRIRTLFGTDSSEGSCTP